MPNLWRRKGIGGIHSTILLCSIGDMAICQYVVSLWCTWFFSKFTTMAVMIKLNVKQFNRWLVHHVGVYRSKKLVSINKIKENIRSLVSFDVFRTSYLTFKDSITLSCSHETSYSLVRSWRNPRKPRVSNLLKPNQRSWFFK